MMIAEGQGLLIATAASAGRNGIYNEGILMRTIYARELVNEFPADVQMTLMDGLQRYLDVTTPADLTADPEQAAADKTAYDGLLSLSGANGLMRTDKDCIAFLVGVTGLSELHCAAFILSESQPWHSQWPVKPTEVV